MVSRVFEHDNIPKPSKQGQLAPGENDADTFRRIGYVARMETTLHHQLKDVFSSPNSRIEVKLGRYRIDVVTDDRLVEIQRSGLASIRDKVLKLCSDGYRVDVVKPLVARKRLVKLNRIDGKVVDERWSPAKATILDLFDELLYFTRVFPHPNLRMIIPMIEIVETRYPGQGRRRRRRRDAFQVKDRHILDMHETHSFETAMCLHRLLPPDLPRKFDTGELAKGLGVPRHQAQRIGYVMRKTGSAVEVGKRGNAIEYKLVSKTAAAKSLRAKKPKQRLLPPAA